MAGIDWARTAPARARENAPSLLDRLPRGVVDWEFAVTLLLCLGAALSVSYALESGGWRDDMPPLTAVTLLAVVSSALIARTRTSMFVAWPLAIVLGTAVVFWQTLDLVGPGTLEQRVDAIYYRFSDWFAVAFGEGVSHDDLPFNVLVLSLTWLGVFLFGWSVFRWHNAWIGLIPGGTVLFLDLILVGDNLTGTVIIYMLLGCLLVMQTHLLSLLKRWREDGVAYPAFINASFLHFSVWALLGVVMLAWIVPVGPYRTPAPVQAGIDRVLDLSTDFVRLAGPLHSNKVVPVHSYSGVLPFQGSISLGDRELMAVTVRDPELTGEMLLRGASYDRYSSGGWRTSSTEEVQLPGGAVDLRQSATADGETTITYPEVEDGTLVPIHIEMMAKSIVGTRIFSPGEAVSLDRGLTVRVPETAISEKEPSPLVSGPTSEERVFDLTLDDGEIPVSVERSRDRPTSVRYLDVSEFGLEHVAEIDPGARIKRYRTYDVAGFIPDYTEDDLRAAERIDTPTWIIFQYGSRPGDVPDRVRGLAQSLTADSETRYDKAKDIEAYLRDFPVAYDVPETPPDRDTVDYFLFDLQRGYFDYHASAMVVMLRSLDIPSRFSVGFAVDIDDYDTETGAYIVRDDNSYAWPEVYFPEYGWVQFNPTPDRPETIQPEVIDPDLLPAGLTGDRTLQDLIPGASRDAYFPPEFAPLEPSQGTGPTFPSESGGGSGPPWGMIAIVAFGAAVVGAASLGWQRSVAGLPYPQQVWEKTVRLASWGGSRPEPGQTPHEYIAALRKRHRSLHGLDVLARSYTGSRFGKKDPDDADNARLREVWPDLRGALVGGIFKRLFRWRRRER